MGQSFDILLTAAALIVGILLLTGHGDFFLKGGNAELRKAKYDEEKMAKGSGVALDPDRYPHRNRFLCKGRYGSRDRLCEPDTGDHDRSWSLPQIQVC